jgi:hypothetical protein
VYCILGIERKIYKLALIYKVDDEGLQGLASGQLPYTKNASSAFYQSEICASNTTQSSSRAWQVRTEKHTQVNIPSIIHCFLTLCSHTLRTQYASHFHSLLNYILDRQSSWLGSSRHPSIGRFDVAKRPVHYPYPRALPRGRVEVLLYIVAELEVTPGHGIIGVWSGE